MLKRATDNVLKPFTCQQLRVRLTKSPKEKVPLSELVFGHTFTDHMFQAEWSREAGGWQAPKIKPFGNISMPPSAAILHYAIGCFEGMKAYKDEQGQIRLFRPDMNMKRLAQSAQRLQLPEFDAEELLSCIKELIKVDASWIPSERGYSVYIRPTYIGTQEWLGVGPSNRAMLFVICSPVGPYYRTGFNAVSLWAEERFVRAWPGGTGCFKIAA